MQFDLQIGNDNAKNYITPDMDDIQMYLQLAYCGSLVYGDGHHVLKCLDDFDT